MEFLADEHTNDGVEISFSSSSTIPCFLRKVLNEEVGNTDSDHKLLVMVVHAVFLEYGFVALDSQTKKKIDGFHLSKGWDSEFTHFMYHRYTIPDLVNLDGDVVGSIVLIFKPLNDKLFIIRYQRERGPQVKLSKLVLKNSHFVPSIKFILSSLNGKENGSSSSSCSCNSDSNSKSIHESRLFELWKTIKDELALPLLIDLCEKNGLPSPPCFMRLPTDLKLNILGLLPGIDIAKMACVSSELRYLSSNNDLWRQKVEEEFKKLEINWKKIFITCWENKGKQKKEKFKLFAFSP